MARPFVTVFLITATIVAYYLEMTVGGDVVACEAFGLTPAHPSLETLFSSLFVHHPESYAHIGWNMVLLAVFGAIVEIQIGGTRTLGLYLLAGALGGILHTVVDPTSTVPLIGASGAIYGLMAVAAVLQPRLLWFVVVMGVVNVGHAFFGGEEGVSFATHIGGLATGVAYGALLTVTAGIPAERARAR